MDPIDRSPSWAGTAAVAPVSADHRHRRFDAHDIASLGRELARLAEPEFERLEGRRVTIAPVAGERFVRRRADDPGLMDAYFGSLEAQRRELGEDSPFGLGPPAFVFEHAAHRALAQTGLVAVFVDALRRHGVRPSAAAPVAPGASRPPLPGPGQIGHGLFDWGPDGHLRPTGPALEAFHRLAREKPALRGSSDAPVWTRPTLDGSGGGGPPWR